MLRQHLRRLLPCQQLKDVRLKKFQPLLRQEWPATRFELMLATVAGFLDPDVRAIAWKVRCSVDPYVASTNSFFLNSKRRPSVLCISGSG